MINITYMDCLGWCFIWPYFQLWKHVLCQTDRDIISPFSLKRFRWSICRIDLFGSVEICRTWPYLYIIPAWRTASTCINVAFALSMVARMELLVGGELEFVAWLPSDAIGGGLSMVFCRSTWRFVKLMPTLQWKMYQCLASSLLIFNP